MARFGHDERELEESYYPDSGDEIDRAWDTKQEQDMLADEEN